MPPLDVCLIDEEEYDAKPTCKTVKYIALYSVLLVLAQQLAGCTMCIRGPAYSDSHWQLMHSSS